MPQPIETKVDVTELMGNEIFLYLLSGKNNFVARVDPRTRFQIGEQVQVVLQYGQHAPVRPVRGR